MDIKSFITLVPGANVIKLFCSQFINFNAKLECMLEQAGKDCHLSGASLQGCLLALPAKIRLGCTGFPGTNTPTYYKDL